MRPNQLDINRLLPGYLKPWETATKDFVAHGEPAASINASNLELYARYKGTLAKFPDLATHVRRADAIVYMMCYHDYPPCQLTAHRWRRFAAHHGHDFLVFRSASNRGRRLSSNVSAVWDKLSAAACLLARGYSLAFHTDADTAVVSWNRSLHSMASSPARLGCQPRVRSSDNVFLLLSEDGGRWRHMVSGPSNFAMLLFRDCGPTRFLLSVLRVMQRAAVPGGMLDHWPAEQLAGNQVLKRRRAMVDDGYDHCSARHGTMQLGVHGDWWGKLVPASGSYSDAAVADFVHDASVRGAWAIHAGGSRTHMPLLHMIVSRLERDLPIPLPTRVTLRKAL